MGDKIDKTLKSIPKGWKAYEHEHTMDSCSNIHVVTIKNTTDGDIGLKPNQIVYFRKEVIDGYTRSGGWYWECGNNPEISRIKGSDLIRAQRYASGRIRWTWISIVPT